jgi:hypothetical protein
MMKRQGVRPKETMPLSQKRLTMPSVREGLGGRLKGNSGILRSLLGLAIFK